MNFTNMLMHEMMHGKMQKAQELIDKQELINKYDGTISENGRIREILQKYSDQK